MPTSTSHITEQSTCIWLDIDQRSILWNEQGVRELFEEAKAIAVREQATVRFMVYAYGQLVCVTAESDLDEMMAKYMSKNYTGSLID